MRQPLNPQQASEQAFLDRYGPSATDLSQLVDTKKSRPPTHNPLTGMQRDDSLGHDPGELTPTEANLCEAAALRLERRWMRKVYDDDQPDQVWDSFATEARNMFAEIGFIIDIGWDEVRGDPAEGLTGRAALPRITILGRIDAHAGTDHDLIKREVAAGLKDGKAGYVREDGTWHEDPLRKQM